MSKFNPADFENTSLGLPEIAAMVIRTNALAKESINMQAKILAKLNGSKVEEELEKAFNNVDDNVDGLMATYLTKK